MNTRICIPLAEIERRAAALPPDYRREIMAAAVQFEASLCFEAEAYLEIVLKYRLPRAAAPFGLGDAVAKVAEPIAKVSDALFGTHLVGCQSCAERRAALNRLVPNLTRDARSP